MKCKYCGSLCIKKGIRCQVQQYYCKLCRKYQRSQYQRKQVRREDIEMIGVLNNEGVGVNSMARVLKLSPGTIINYLRKISVNACCLVPDESGQEYEVDEIRTFVRRNNAQHAVWIMYAINRATRRVIHFIVGRRTKENLYALIKVLQNLEPKRIYTDSLNIYPGIIRKDLHNTWKHGTNYVERRNLTLRTHLKRLGRKTICFSKSREMLEVSLRIYFSR